MDGMDDDEAHHMGEIRHHELPAPPSKESNQMSKVELLDAELIATLKATAWHLCASHRPQR